MLRDHKGSTHILAIHFFWYSLRFKILFPAAVRVSFLVTAHCVGLNNLITIIIDLEVLFKVESATPSIIRFRIALFITSEANIYIVIYLAVISGKLKLRKVFCTVKDWANSWIA